MSKDGVIISTVEEFVITDSSGRCKCCLSDKDLKTIWDQHEFERENENYGEMLKECFNIEWEPSAQDMICETCVTRLRDATDFRREIMATQTLLEEGVYINVKLEEDEDIVCMRPAFEKVEYLDDDDDDDDENYVPKDAPSSSETSKPEMRVRKYPSKLLRSERNKTYKQYSRSDLMEAVQLVYNGQMSCAEAARMCGVPKGTVLAKVHEVPLGNKDVDEVKEVLNEKHYNLVEEIKKLLLYTTAIPFKTRATKYYCFYCTYGQAFEDPDDLREHTNTVHSKIRINSIEQQMKPQWMNEVIKLDVQNLGCTECSEVLPDWNHMFVHFAEVHEIGFDEAYAKVIPYALSLDLKCILCHEGFANFGLLDAHMNQHYSNHICYKCGCTFLSTARLDKHLIVHKTGNFKCKLCDKVFTIQKYLTKHFTLVHKPKCSTKCMYCPEKFLGPFQRQVHITEKHKEKVKTFTCEVCGKEFTWKPYFVTHMRRRHRAVKKIKCEYCPKMFKEQNELNRHMEIHSQATFVCGDCGDTFPRISALRKHLQSHQ